MLTKVLLQQYILFNFFFCLSTMYCSIYSIGDNAVFFCFIFTNFPYVLFFFRHGIIIKNKKLSREGVLRFIILFYSRVWQLREHLEVGKDRENKWETETEKIGGEREIWSLGVCVIIHLSSDRFGTGICFVVVDNGGNKICDGATNGSDGGSGPEALGRAPNRITTCLR